MTKQMSEMKSEDSDYTHIEETYDRGSRDYGDYFKTPHQFIEPERQQFIQQLFAGSKILDCGCGPGMDAEKFSQLGYNVTAIDLSERFVKPHQRTCPNGNGEKNGHEASGISTSKLRRSLGFFQPSSHSCQRY
jgi:2-polyprenyl-3-methyl-5-hydroxy-6-metoxy-1,4-benzoquinol methylase